jgi:hypothetical protein
VLVEDGCWCLGFGPGWAGLVVRARGHIAGLDLVRQIWPPATVVAKLVSLVHEARCRLEVLRVGRKGRIEIGAGRVGSETMESCRIPLR